MGYTCETNLNLIHSRNDATAEAVFSRVDYELSIKTSTAKINKTMSCSFFYYDKRNR